MVSQTPIDSADQFLTIEETARMLSIDPVDLKQGIARGLVPIRHDNQGALRIHLAEVPDDLSEQIPGSQVSDKLHAEVLQDEVSTLSDHLHDSDKLRTKLEALLEQQAGALMRSEQLLDQRENDIQKLSSMLDSSLQMLNQLERQQVGDSTNKSPEIGVSDELQKIRDENSRLEGLLRRAFTVIEDTEKLSNTRTLQFTSTTEKAMKLLEQAVSDSEAARADVHRLSALMDQSLNTTTRIEGEIEQRNAVIDKQHELMQRLVAVSEQSVATPPVKTERKLSFWQRLWGGGKGI